MRQNPGANSIAEQLAKCKIQRLNLSNNIISDVVGLIDALKASAPLTHLQLEENEISANDGAKIAAAAAKSATLTTLELRGNRALSRSYSATKSVAKSAEALLARGGSIAADVYVRENRTRRACIGVAGLIMAGPIVMMLWAFGSMLARW